MRILLVQPEFCSGAVSFRAVAMPEPLALELLAATVPEHDVRILDLRVDADLDAALQQFNPDVVAVTALTTEVYAARAVLARAKQYSAEIFTIGGGQHATLLPRDFAYPQVDAICLGEGEFVFPPLIAALAAGKRSFAGIANLVWRNADGEFVANGREVPQGDAAFVPHPRRDLVAHYRSAYSWLYDKPDTAIATGRGCPHRCNFCSVWKFYEGRTRQMCARRVLEEVRRAETPHITFLDDNFIFNGKREHEIADMIRAEGLKFRFGFECRTDAIVRHPDLIEKWAGLGLENVLLGLEGASDDMLAGVNKRNTARNNDEAIRILQANGVMIWGAFICDPDWTADQFQRLSDYFFRKQITHPQFTILTPLPGTELHEQRRADLLTDDYTCFDTLHAVLPTRLPREEFYQCYAALYKTPRTDALYEAVQSGRLTMEQLRWGYEVLKAFSRWENFAERDPILGNRRRAPEDDGEWAAARLRFDVSETPTQPTRKAGRAVRDSHGVVG